jgi:hypothetical protein
MNDNNQSSNLYESDLNEYFRNSTPFLSDNNVEFICKEIDESYDYFIEYGLGSSTLYFIEKFKHHNLTLISVENTFPWFCKVVKYLKDKFVVNDVFEKVNPFSISEILQFLSQLEIANPEVPVKLSRRISWKENLLLGEFRRLLPDSPSKFSGLIPFWSFFRPFFIILNFVVYIFFRRFRPQRALFTGRVDSIKLVLRNVPPSMKDQYGESPSKDEYINAGLIELQQELKKQKIVKAAFFIDGGPRAEITRKILELENQFSNFYPTIFLCEAHRAYYNEVMNKRPTGKFLPGSNLTLNGEVVQGDPGKHDEETSMFWFGQKNITKEELSKKEVWYYKG